MFGLNFKPSSAHVIAEVEPGELQEVLHAWLQTHANCQITHLAQSQNPEGRVTVTIIYFIIR